MGIIALDMQPNNRANGDATSSSSGTNAAVGHTSHNSGNPHLINLLDNEGEGGTVHWVEPHHRELAIEARLEAFRQEAMSSGSNIQDTYCEEWPEFSQELGNIIDMDNDDAQGVATPVLATFSTEAVAFPPEHTLMNPPVHKLVPSKILNDFALDMRRLSGPPP